MHPIAYTDCKKDELSHTAYAILNGIAALPLWISSI